MRARPVVFLALALPILIAGCQGSRVSPPGGNGSEPLGGAESEIVPGAKGNPSATENYPDLPELDQEIESILSSSKVPGANVAIVKDGKVAFAKGYGKASLEPAVPMKGDTVLNVASISKTVAAVAAMKLVEEGKLQLDGDVSDTLGFTLRNPNFESVPITLRMLLAHTSSIDMSDTMEKPLDEHFVEGKDSTFPLKDLVTGIFKPGEKWYAEDHYTKAEPGSAFKYCNICPSVTAVLVEKASGKPFDAYCKSAIFAPLGMKATSWRIGDFDSKQLAVGYSTWNGGFEPSKPQGHVYYPATTLRMTAADLGRLIVEFTTKHAVLKEGTFRSMIEDRGASGQEDVRLGFFGEPGAEGVIGHNGSDMGHSANFGFDPESGTGVAVLLNSDVGGDSEEPPYLQIQNALWSAADGL
jgi:CubicO group peptidase (beta-lactamase class C family)